MAWVPGVGHVPGPPGVVGRDPYDRAGYGYPMGAGYVIGASFAAANAIANANAMAEATAANQAAAMQAAQNAAAAVNSRAQFVQALQMHLASIAPAIAANPDASAHLAAAQTIAAQLA